ncbi:WXG100 family type VII secretion target [Butyrivibrio sp. JL13D10]|uniref:WXG100 family type VII secretion target n=1 Tax=Butyrivibrio sp. JL13D10 TaxID=3236815 RepID=UPI0038B64013
MANVIRVTPEELKAAAGRMETHADIMEQKTNAMIEIIDTLTGRIWSGEAQKEYVSRFDTLELDITRLHKLVEDHVDHLNTIANEYQSAESSNMDVATSLTSDIIS